MSEFILPVLLVVGYLFVMKWVLPRMGVPT